MGTLREKVAVRGMGNERGGDSVGAVPVLKLLGGVVLAMEPLL